MFISWLMRLLTPLMPVPRPRGRHARTGRRPHSPPSLPAPTATRAPTAPALLSSPPPAPPHSRRVVGPWYVAWERRQSPDPLDTLRAELAPLVRGLVAARAEALR